VNAPWIAFAASTGTIVLALVLAIRGEKAGPSRAATIVVLLIVATLQVLLAAMALSKELPPSTAQAFADSFAKLPVYGEGGYVIVNQDADLWSKPDEPDHVTLWTHRGDTWGKHGEHLPPKNVVSRACTAERFEIQTSLRGFNPNKDWQQAGLIAYHDFDNYVRLTVQSHKMDGQQIQGIQWVLERNGKPQPWNETSLHPPRGFARLAADGPIKYITLKITRDLDRWTFWYSLNQHSWEKLAEETFYLDPTYVGILALHGDTYDNGSPIELQPIAASFDDFQILPFP
jgi:beta-xylosidase